MKKLITPILTMIFILFNSCATVFTGTTQNILIESNPSGANVTINNQNYGSTPARVTIKKNLDDVMDGGRPVKLELDGYKTETFTLHNSFNPVAILNLIFLYAWAIDAATGAMMSFDDSYSFGLIKEASKSEDKLNEIKSSDDKNKKDADSDKYEKLRDLKKLLDDGVISESDYEKEKAKILNDSDK